MLSILSDVFRIATREDRWSGHQAPRTHDEMLSQHHRRKAEEAKKNRRHLERFGR